jgi:tetratricopeptide (TPR) repeat protein
MAWEKAADNNFPESIKLFEKAIAEDNDNTRAYLALSYIMQLKSKNEKAWDYYEKALKSLNNPYPYIFAAALTNRSLLVKNPAEDKGIMKIFPELIENKDVDPMLRASTIERMARYQEEYGSLKKAKKYFDKLNAIEKWTLIGPFENISASGFDKVFMPEKEYAADKVYEGKNGIPAAWFEIKQIRNDRWIDFTRYFSQFRAIFYGNTFVYSPKEQTVQLRVGTSGSLKAFVNDQLIMSYFDENNNDLDTYIAETKLNEGWNRVLIKCGFSEISQCNFLVRITNQEGNVPDGIKISTKLQSYKKISNAPVKHIHNFAERFFEEEIRKNPENIENYLLLSDCYLRNDKAVEAENILRKAEKMIPNSVLIKNSLLEAFLRGEKYDEISSTIAKIYDLDPNIPFILEQKYAEYEKNENMEQLEKVVDQYSKLMPESPTSLIMQMNIAFKKGKVEHAFDLLEIAYNKFPLNWDVVYLKALFSVRTTQKYDTAIKIYIKFLKKRRTVNAYASLGDYYLKASKVDEFEKTFNDIIKTDPSSKNVYFSLANVFFQLQQYGKASSYIVKALDICPNQSSYWAKYGEITQASGEKELAIKAYRNALKYSATDYKSRRMLREIEEKKSIFNQFGSENIDSLIKNAPNAEDYPRDGGVYLLDDKKRVVYERGTSEIQNEILIKLFNSDGIDQFKEYYLPYNSYSENLIIDKAVVYKKNGTEVKADIKDNLLVFKSLEDNDFIYIKWRIENYNKGRLSQHFWDQINFNYSYPIKKIRYSLLLPEEYKFKYKTKNMKIEPLIEKTDEGVLYEWSLENQAAIEYEYSMPHLNDVGKMLYLSSIPDWEYLVNWYLDLAKTKTRSSFEIKNRVEALLETKPNATELEKIELIYNYITENISYSSVSFRQSGLIPQKARDVLVQRIGDCKDVATLCIAMLKEAGISANYVLVNTFDEGQNSDILPAIEFNHAIVGIERENGQDIFLDLTAKNYALFTVPNMDIDAFALKIIPGTKAPFYLTSKYFLPGATKRYSTVEIEGNNTIKISRETVKIGIPASTMRTRYRYTNAQQRLEKLGEALAGEFPGVKIDSFEIENIDEISSGIKYNYDFTVPNYLIDAGNMKLLKIPWTDNWANRRSLSKEKRKFDYLYRTTNDTLFEEMSIMLPKGFEPVGLNKKVIFKSSMAEYKVEMEYKKGKITASRLVTVKEKIIPPERYLEFKKFYNDVVRNDMQQIILKKR